MIARVYPFACTLPTYGVELASRLAPLFVMGKAPLYPYTNFVRTEKQAHPRTYQMWALENRYLRALVAPELGGRVYSLRDKRLPTPAGRSGPGAELLYDNSAIKPIRIEPRSAWICAGIEFNFPVAHSHTSLEPVASRAYAAGGRACVEVGETERRLGLSWVVRLSLGADDPFLTQETFLRNPSPRPARWQFWSNAGIDGFDDTEMVYAPAEIFVHETKGGKMRWPTEWKCIGEREGMLGLFWMDQRDLYFGAFHHRLGVGLLHLADPKVVPGMKLWTFGRKGTYEWAKIVSDDARGYAEVQSGAFKTQEEFGTLAPGEERYFVEFWTGAAAVDEYAKAALPRPGLTAEPPRWFGMEHIPEAQRWLKLLEAHARQEPARIPDYNPADIDWPPTGLELEATLRWAAEHRSAYHTALGTWLAARGKYAEACAALARSEDPCGLRVEGILAWRHERNLPKARALFERANLDDLGHQLDYDALLAHLGDYAARAEHLARMNREDGRVVERLADQAVATGRPQEALDLLLKRTWQRQHEHFVRSDIWRRARAALGLTQDPVPAELGEDAVPPVTQAPTPHGTLDGLLRRVPELPAL